MSYSANITKKKFLITHDCIEPAFDDAKEYLLKLDKKILYTDKEDIQSASNLMELFEAFGFEVELDPKTYDINKIDFVWEKMGEEEYLFEQIALYVQHGSYIQWTGEDGDIWRHVFENGEVKIVKPKMIW